MKAQPERTRQASIEQSCSKKNVWFGNARSENRNKIPSSRNNIEEHDLANLSAPELSRPSTRYSCSFWKFAQLDIRETSSVYCFEIKPPKEAKESEKTCLYGTLLNVSRYVRDQGGE